MITKEQIIEQLKKVEDPELNLDVWTLGLIYDIGIKDKDIMIKMTLTTPLCPYGPMIIDEIKTRVKEVASEVDIELVFDPPWEPSDEVKDLLGLPV